MKNIKYIAQGFLLLTLSLGVAGATSALADNNNDSNSNSNFLNVRASLKADALINLESSIGVVTGPNGAIRALSANVTSVSNGDINASLPFGNSSLNFVVHTDANTKLNGKVLGSAYVSTLNALKAGDKISFSGVITSSSSSSITVAGSHIVSRALFTKNVEGKTSFKGNITAINTSDNSFTLSLDKGGTVKVNTSSSTVITVDGVVGTLSSLAVGNEVHVNGALNSDGSVITALKVTSVSENDNNDNSNNSNKNDQNENKGGWFGKILNWFWK